MYPLPLRSFRIKDLAKIALQISESKELTCKIFPTKDLVSGFKYQDIRNSQLASPSKLLTPTDLDIESALGELEGKCWCRVGRMSKSQGGREYRPGGWDTPPLTSSMTDWRE